MAEFLLIHGAAHGAWCWRKVIPTLEAFGHRARAIDLPGHGEDPLPYTEVTLERYRDAVLGALTGGEIVVGHSMGGYPITAAAEAAPEKVAGLVYLCAYTPWPGLSLSEMRMKAPYQPLLSAIRMTEDRKGWTADPEMVPGLFYHDCTPEDVAFAMERLCVQATQPTSVPVAMSDRYASVPRYYIRCAEDRTIPPEFQHTMTEGWPEGHVIDMQTSHSPFFSAPADLVAHLDRISKEL